MSNLPQGMAINAEVTAEFSTILTPEALALVAKLHRTFEPRRQELLKARVERTKRLDAGERPDFLAETKHIARVTGKLHRFLPLCNVAALKLPALLKRRW